MKIYDGLTPFDIKIRQAEISDWSTLWPLLDARGSTAETSVRERFSAFVEDASHFLPVAQNVSQLVGYAWVQDYGPHLRAGTCTARLHDLYVMPIHRRRGIAKRLMGAVEAWARQKNITYLQWQANRASVSFYEALSFQGVADPDPEHPFFEIHFDGTF